MNYFIKEWFSYSVAMPLLVSLFKMRRTEREFVPFIILLWLGLITELISTLQINSGQSNAEISNIYVLFEPLLLLWQFNKWGLFDRRRGLFISFLVSFTLLWTAENFFIASIHYFSSYFRTVYSYAIVLMSIHILNKIILTGNNPLLLNSIFLACLGFIVYFTFKALVEIFWLYGLNGSMEFRGHIYNIMAYINLFTNLVYALAILWIPKKREYSLL